MKRAKASLKSDSSKSASRTTDIPGALANTLKEARLRLGLSQAELAARLGLRQRQISDLERATMDPRISTVSNVAGALDLEVMLVPRQRLNVIESLSRTPQASQRPMYSLDASDEEFSE